MTAKPTTPGTSPWPSHEDRSRTRDQKIESLLDTALIMFLELGYHHVTLTDVAKRLHVTKPALYNYFRSKEDILFQCWANGYQKLNERIGSIGVDEKTGLARLRRLICIYAETMTTDYGKSLVRFDDHHFEEVNRKKTIVAKRELDQVFRRYIQEGIADGSIRDCDPKITGFAIAGALNWIGHWYRHGHGLSPELLGKDFSIRLTEALARV